MSDLQNIEVKKKDFLTYLDRINEKMDTYLNALKVNSSEEVLKGSPEKAKRYLEELISLQNCTNKLYLASDEVLKLLNSEKKSYGENNEGVKKAKDNTGVNKNSNVHNSESKTSDKQLEQGSASEKKKNDDNKKTSNNNEVNILKALIYMGGSAGIGEINEYLNNYFDSNSNNGDGKTKSSDIKKIVENMNEQELLEMDSFNEKFEILQKGIDYLAKYEI